MNGEVVLQFEKVLIHILKIFKDNTSALFQLGLHWKDMPTMFALNVVRPILVVRPNVTRTQVKETIITLRNWCAVDAVMSQEPKCVQNMELTT